MKYRTDFVTNSSSSSFVVEIKNKKDKFPSSFHHHLLKISNHITWKKFIDDIFEWQTRYSDIDLESDILTKILQEHGFNQTKLKICHILTCMDHGYAILSTYNKIKEYKPEKHVTLYLSERLHDYEISDEVGKFMKNKVEYVVDEQY